MLLSSLVPAVVLSACLVTGTPSSFGNLHPSSFGNLPHNSFGSTGSIGAILSTRFDASVGIIDRYKPTFTQACQQKKTDVLIQGLVDIKASISVLGSADGLAQVDVNILTTKVLNLMVKLQAVLKVIDQYKLTSSCSSAIVDLKDSLQIMISAVASQNTDITAQCNGAGVELEFYARVGIKLDLGAQVAAGGGTDADAGVGTGVDASTKVITDLQAAISVTADIQPKFKSACEKKDVRVVVSSLATVRTSILSIAANINAFTKVDANVLNTNLLSLFVKLQVLLRLISDNNLSSRCQGDLISLQAPLKSIVASVGVDVSAKLSKAVDVNIFAKVGLDVGFGLNAAAGVGTGTGTGTGVGVGTGGIAGTGAGAGVNVDASTKVVADLQAAISVTDDIAPKFKNACEQKNIDVVVSSLATIRTSILSLGTNVNAFAKADVNVLSSNIVNLFVKLQFLLRLISDNSLSSPCQSAIASLKAPLQAMVSVVASVGVDVSAKLSSAVDVNLFTKVGLDIGLTTNIGSGAPGVGAGTGVGAGAGGVAETGSGTSTGVNVNAATKVVADLQAAISVTADIAPKFKSACEQKNIDVVVRSLATIRTSILSLGTNVNAFAKVDANVLSTNVLSIFVKLQVLLRLISDNNLISPCQSAIVSLQAPLKSIVAYVGVAVSSTVSSAVDVNLFSKVGLDVGLGPNVAGGVGNGTGTSTGGIAGTGTGAEAGTGTGVGAGVNVDASAKAVAGLQSAISVTANIAPKFKSACEQKNVGVVISSLATIRTSILSLGTNVSTFAQVDANILSDNVLSLFVKLQVLIRLISDNNLSSSCQSAIFSLQAPLKTIVESVGVNVSAKISSTVDVSLFTKVGLDVGISSSVAAGVGSGFGGVGTVTDGAVAAGSGVQADTSGKVVTNLQASVSLMAELEPKFKTACANKNTEVLVSGLANIRTSIASLGTSANVYAKVDANILATNVLGLFVKLQVLIRVIYDSKMGPSCHDAIASLQAPLKAVVSVVASVGVDISAKISAAVDVNLFSQIGLDIGVDASVGAGAGAGAATGAGADTSTKVFADLKASTGAAVTLAPTFKTACEQKNVAVLNQGLVSIVASITSVGARADVLAHVSTNDLCSQYFDLLIKVQILLKIIDQHSLTSSCKGSIASLNAPLKALLSVLVSAGVNVSAKAKAFSTLDPSFFASVGVQLGIQASASVDNSQ